MRRRFLQAVVGPLAGLAVAALVLGAGFGPYHPTPAVAAPQLKPAPPEFEAVTVYGHWDGDASIQPWLRGEDGVVWVLGFPSQGVQDVTLKPLDTSRRLRATGLAATSGKYRCLFVATLTPLD